MGRTNSIMLPLGTPLPFFELMVVPGTNLNEDNDFFRREKITNDLLQKKPILLMFICAHCPFVKHLEVGLKTLDEDYGEKVQILAICSNSLITHPQDGPKNLALQVKKQGWRFPYLLDSNQTFAKDLKAACTPDFFVFAPAQDEQYLLRYRGQFDDSRPGNDIQVSGKDLRVALDAILNNQIASFDQKPSIGCNIKWHPGQEPSWFG